VDLAADGQARSTCSGKAHPYDLVITDSNMPGVSGIRVIEHLRKIGFPGKIFLLSGSAAELEEEYQSLNVDKILQKPFTFAVLLAAVNETTAA